MEDSGANKKGVKVMKARIVSVIIALTMMCSLLLVPALAENDGLLGPVVLTGGRRDMLIPTAHRLQSDFYDDRNHYALDFTSGTLDHTVIACYDGTIYSVFEGGYGDGYGNYIVVQHDYLLLDGTTITLYSKYNHCNTLAFHSADIGKKVKAGDTLAYEGKSGIATGVHVDFQIFTSPDFSKEKCIDPYANQLLELPDDLYISDEYPCGIRYMDAVRAIYSEPLEYPVTPIHTVDIQTVGTSKPLFGGKYTAATNTFDLIDRDTRAQLTSSNSGCKMLSMTGDGTSGVLTLNYDCRIGNSSVSAGESLYYRISKMKDGGTITFTDADSCVKLTGKIHTYNNGSTFGSIIKIDCLEGNVYFKYSK